MLTFKQFLAEMQASNDNPEYQNIKNAHNDSIKSLLDVKIPDSEKEFHRTRVNALRHSIGHPPISSTASAAELRKSLLESKTLKAFVAATMLAATPAQAGGMAHELPVHSYEEIQNPNVSRETIERSKQALEKAQDEYDESMPGQHLSDAIDAHNNGDIKAAMEHLGIHNKMINKRQSAPMS